MGLTNGVKSRFYNIAGEIRETTTGRAFSTEAEFIKASGMNVAQATQAGLITEIIPGAKTADMTEYNFAVSQGYKASLMDWQKQQANLKNPTPESTPSETKVSYNTASTNLKNQNIPSVVLNKNGTLSATYRKKINLPEDHIDWLWEQITNGASFEEIRQAIRDGGGDPKILDTFVQTLQQ